LSYIHKKYCLNFNYFLIIIFLLFANKLIFANDLIISKTEIIQNNSKINSKLYLWETNSNNPIIIKDNNLKFIVNGSEKNIESITNYKYEPKINNEILIAIPITKSYDFDKFEKFKSILINFIDNIDTSTVKLALIAYNTNSYLLTNFTNDKTKLKKSINLLEQSGGNSFDAIINSVSFNLKNLFTNTNSNKFVFDFIYGNSEISSNEILNIVNNNSIKINFFDLDNVSNKNIKDLTSNSNINLIEKNLDSVSINDNLLIEYFYLLGYSPYLITWDSDICISKKDLLIELINTNNIQLQKNVNLNIRYETASISSIPSILKYNDILISTTYRQNVNIRTNENYKIKDIIFSNTRINISGIKINDILDKTKDNIFFIEYKAIDTNYFYGEVDIIFDNCQSTKIIIFAGKIENLKQNTLELISPNGSENLLSETNFKIDWKGINKEDSINIYHSIDNGKKWDLIIENGNNLSYNWLIPNLEGNSNKIKIEQINNVQRLIGVNYLFQTNPYRINSILEWNYDGSLLATANKDESIILWNPYIEKRLQLVYQGSFTDIYDIKWSSVRNYLATTFQSNISGNDIVIFDYDNNLEVIKLTGSETKVTKLSWNKDGNVIAGITQDKKLHFWNVVNNSIPFNTFDFTNGSLVNMSYNPVNNWIVVADNIGNLFIFDLDNKIQNLIVNLTTPLKDFSWSPDGNNIILSDNSPNISCYNVIVRDNKFSFEKKYDIIRQNSPIYNHKINGVDWSKDGTLLVTFADKYVQVWNSFNGELIYTYLGHNSVINDAKVNAQNSIASSGNLNIVHNWNLNNIPHKRKILQSDSSDLTFSISNIKLNYQNQIDLGTYCIDQILKSQFNNIIKNNSNVPITIDSISISGVNSNEFSNITLSKYILKQNESTNLLIDFIPIFIGQKAAILNIHILNKIYTINVSGFCKNTLLSLNNNIIFEDTPLNENNIQNLIVKNKGNLPEIINNINFLNSDNVFSIIKFIPNSIIKPQDSIIIEVLFNPKNNNLYGGVLKLNINDDCSPIEIVLKGKGVSPALKLKNDELLINNNCDIIKIDTFFTIKNYGNGNLIIKEVNLLGDIFSEIILKDNFILNKQIIKPNDTFNIKYTYTPINLDTTKLVYQIYTNLLQSNQNITQHSINIFSKKPLITIDNKLIDFKLVAINKFMTKNITLINEGNVTINFNSSYNFNHFNISNIKVLQLEPLKSTEAEITFIGFNKDTLLEENIIIKYDCNDLEILAKATVGSNVKVLDYVENISFGDFNCKTLIDTNTRIYNIGNKPIIIDSIYFKFTDNRLMLVGNYINLILEANESLNIQYNFQILNSENYINSIIIYSNSDNSVDNKIEIPINFNIYLYNILLEKNTLNFEVLNPHQIFYSELNILNYGDLKINWNDYFSNFPINLGNNFYLDSISPLTNNINFNSKFYFSYKPTKFDEINEIDFFLPNLCNYENKVSLKGKVTGSNYIKLKLGDLKSNTKENVVLPLFLKNINQLNLEEDTDINLKISFNSTILFPYSNINNIYDSSYIENNKRFIIRKFKYKINNDNILTEFNFISTLGDTSFTNIEIEYALWNDTNNIYVFLENGSFELLDICYIDGGRFIKNTGNFKIINLFPNPTENKLNLQFSLIESNNTIIDIIDVRGTIAKNLLNKFLEYGEYNMEFDISELSDDTYFVVLKTNNINTLQKFMKMR